MENVTDQKGNESGGIEGWGLNGRANSELAEQN